MICAKASEKCDGYLTPRVPGLAPASLVLESKVYGISTEETVRRERLRERRLSNLGIRVIRFDKSTLADGSAMDALRLAINATDTNSQLTSGLGRAVTTSGSSSNRETQRFVVSGGFPTWTTSPTANALRAF